ncbi:MAG: hypothetical protein WAL56_12210 [Candidatus Sulfotelmatobacter sp.]
MSESNPKLKNETPAAKAPALTPDFSVTIALNPAIMFSCRSGSATLAGDGTEIAGAFSITFGSTATVCTTASAFTPTSFDGDWSSFGPNLRRCPIQKR